MHRRTYLSTCTVIGSLTGCIGTDDDSDPETDDADTTADTDESTPDPQLESVSATDITRGDTDQQLQLSFDQVKPTSEFTVYVDVSSLDSVTADPDAISVIADIDLLHTGEGWHITNLDYDETSHRIAVSMRTDADATQEYGLVTLELTDLDTSSVPHEATFTHAATLHTSDDGDPDFDAGRTASYETIDPDELENVLHLSTDDIRIGESMQELQLYIEHATTDIRFRIDLTPLTDVHINIEDASIAVELFENNLTDDIPDVDVIHATVDDGIVHLDLHTSADIVRGVLRLESLDTDDAEPSDGLAYPIYVGDRPDEPDESRTFRIAGAVS